MASGSAASSSLASSQVLLRRLGAAKVTPSSSASLVAVKTQGKVGGRLVALSGLECLMLCSRTL